MTQATTETIERKRYTPDEYFVLEEASEERHEYIDGRILAMAGASDSHNVIVVNSIFRLSSALEGLPCRPMGSDTQLRYGTRSHYGYADVSVVCGKREYEELDRGRRRLLNPTLIVEVLSPSTELFDRGRKFSLNREIATFREYVLVSQTEPRIETFFKQDDGTWRFASFVGLDAVVPLTSIGVGLLARQVYADVIFPPSEPDGLEPLA